MIGGSKHQDSQNIKQYKNKDINNYDLFDR